MRNSRPKAIPEGSDKRSQSYAQRHELVLSSGLSLVHDPFVHRGKTVGMDKGLFIFIRGRLCAGESAGLGLPVWKTGGITFFPSSKFMEAAGENTIHKVFTFDRTIAWTISGMKAPAGFGWIMERLVEGYMKKTAWQKLFLKVRNRAFSTLRIKSGMVPCKKGKGSCEVTYEAVPEGMLVHVVSFLPGGQGRLIMLNEVDGESFSVLRMGNRLYKGQEIPAWAEASFDAVIESPKLRIGVSLAPDKGEDPSGYTVFCGRELGFGLDWAGISLVNGSRSFTYQVRIKQLPD